MNGLRVDHKTDRVNNRAQKSKRRLLAVSILFVVACSFSYCAGMQQNGDTGKLLTKTTTSNSENMNQNTTQTSLENNLTQQELPANNQYEENTGAFSGRLRHHGRHGYFHGNYGYNGGKAVEQNNQLSQQQYDAAPQRCCATGKTGTCHSY
jgi:hypothetical protein